LSKIISQRLKPSSSTEESHPGWWLTTAVGAGTTRFGGGWPQHPRSATEQHTATCKSPQQINHHHHPRQHYKIITERRIWGGLSSEPSPPETFEFESRNGCAPSTWGATTRPSDGGGLFAVFSPFPFSFPSLLFPSSARFFRKEKKLPFSLQQSGPSRFPSSVLSSSFSCGSPLSSANPRKGIGTPANRGPLPTLSYVVEETDRQGQRPEASRKKE